MPIDAGEKEAIYLATRVPNSLVLLDDLKAREEAKALRLAVKGTIGVLVQAYRNNLVTLGEIDTIFEAIIANDDIWIASGFFQSPPSRLPSPVPHPSFFRIPPSAFPIPDLPTPVVDGMFILDSPRLLSL